MLSSSCYHHFSALDLDRPHHELSKSQLVVVASLPGVFKINFKFSACNANAHSTDLSLHSELTFDRDSGSFWEAGLSAFSTCFRSRTPVGWHSFQLLKGRFSSSSQVYQNMQDSCLVHLYLAHQVCFSSLSHPCSCWYFHFQLEPTLVFFSTSRGAFLLVFPNQLDENAFFILLERFARVTRRNQCTPYQLRQLVHYYRTCNSINCTQLALYFRENIKASVCPTLPHSFN